MLHVHNGDSSANVLKESGLGGEHLVWREALIEGPTPAGLTPDEWRAVRARHLAETYGLKFDECFEDLRGQEEALACFPEHEEVVLWFEHDLFCQAMLLYLLDWFSRRELGRTRLSLVCVGEFPGVGDFRGLGQLSPAQMASLFDTRHRVAEEELRLAARAWRAYCAPDPRALQDLLADDTSALPFLKPALRAHLERFPSTRNGLGRVENLALELVAEGNQDFRALFAAFGRRAPLYGLGDAQLWLVMKRLLKAPRPLLSSDVDADRPPTPETLADASFALTDEGRAVLAGGADFVGQGGTDYWLGGVHLSDTHDVWRWDERRQTITTTVR